MPFRCVRAHSLVTRLGTLQTLEEAAIDRSLQQLRTDISKLSIVSDFVEVSLKKRQIVKLEKQAAAAAMERQAARAQPAASMLLAYAAPLCYALIAIMCWGNAVAAVPVGLLGWLAPLVSLPDCSAGTISVAAWCAVCHAVAARGVAVAEASLFPAAVAGRDSSLPSAIASPLVSPASLPDG